MYWTDETYRIHDFTPGEMELGSAEHIKRSAECYEPEDRPVILAAFNRCAEVGHPYDLEMPFTTAKGRRLWIRTSARPVFDGEKLVRVIGNIMDITELKRAEDEREEIAQKNSVLYEFSPDAHIVGEIGEDGRDLGFVDCNRVALDLLGLTREQLLAADAVSLSPERQPDGRLSREKAGELIARCLAEGSLRFDWLHCRADGAPFPVEITMIVYHEQGKTFLHSIWRDMTGLTRTALPTAHPAASHQERKTHER